MLNDQLLEDVLNQLKRNNGLQQALVDDLRRDLNGRRGGRGGQPPPERSRQKKSKDDPSKSLNNLAGAAASLSGGLLKANNASAAIGSVTKIMPVFGGAVGAAALAVQQFYEFLNGNLQAFNELNEAGLSASGGMFGLQKALATGRLSMDEFMSATANYKDVIASMGAEGVQKFGNLMNSVIETQESMGSLNISNKTLASSLAGYIKQQRAYSSFDKMDRQIQAKAARDYADQLQKYSKGLGMTVDELSGKMAKSSESMTGLGTQIKLMEEGMSEEDATKSSENLGMVLSSFGAFGEQMHEQLSRFIITGGDLDLESTVGKLYQVDDQFKELFNRTAQMTKDGTMTSKEGMEMLKSMIASKETSEGIRNSLIQSSYSFDKASADMIAGFHHTVRNYNTSTEKATSQWDQMMTLFNKHIEDFVQSFKIGTAELFMDPQSFILNMFGDKWGNWLLHGAFGWDIDKPIELPTFKEFLHKYVGETAEWMYDMIMGYGTDAAARIQAIPQPSWETILRALVPTWLADIIFEGGSRDAGIAGASEMGDQFQQVFEKKFLPGFEEGMEVAGNSIKDSLSALGSGAESVMGSLKTWWDKPSSQTVVTNSTINNQSSVVNKPTTVQEAPAADKTADIQKRQEEKEHQETLIEKMERIIRAMVESNDTNREVLRVSKETATNTANTSLN